MKFVIEYNSNIEQRLLTYNIEECSFDIEPTVQKINYDIVINKLNLTVTDDNRVVQILGFCGFATWIKTNHNVPEYKKGVLKVLDDLEVGVGSYSIRKEEFPVYVNTQTGWVCIGYPEKSGNAVEFINNCVVVINGDDEFISLWLKPLSLPEI